MSFIKWLALAFLLIIQTGAFSSNPRTPSAYAEQWAVCDPVQDATVIYSENNTLHIQATDRSCTFIVGGHNTSLEIHTSEHTFLFSIPKNQESGWLYLGGKFSVNIYYSGIYNIYVKGKLQEVALQLPVENSNVIYEKGAHEDYRQLRSADALFSPIEFQSHTVTLLSSEKTT